MMKKVIRLALLPVVCAALSVTSCSEPVLVETVYESTDLPVNGVTLIPFNGGVYTLNFKTEVVTKADTTYRDCQYRINYGDQVGEAVTVDHGIRSVDVVIEPNYSENKRKVSVETAEVTAEPQWETVIKAFQAPALEKSCGFYWAKGNVVLRDGRFAIADDLKEPGLFFPRGGSRYGVPAGASYAGTAYGPEPVKVPLEELYSKDQETYTDVCTMVDPGLRTPSYMELYYLYAAEDLSKSESEGLSGIGFKDTYFFLPFYGGISLENGTYIGKGEYGGYLGLGSNFSGDGVIYSMNREYTILDYNLAHLTMGSLRCVKNTALPSYVSHEPAEAADCRAFDIKVVTDPGAFELYEISWESDAGDVLFEDATDKVPEQVFTIPANTTHQAKAWKLFVNRIYTGKSFVQPELTDYVRYVSHDPGKAEAEAFRLSVTFESDLPSFTVAIKGTDGYEAQQEGSKDKLTVVFDVPANTGDERTFSISVNGNDLGKTVVQAAAPKTALFSVIWSPAALTIKDGKYVFAAPGEKPMLFKWKSRYGISYAAGNDYPGKAYGPEEKAVNFSEIPDSEVDPCTLVEPQGTWRMPSMEELLELVSYTDPVLLPNVSWTLTDGDQSVTLLGAGSSSSGKRIADKNIMIWSSDPELGGKCQYLMWFTQDGKQPKQAKTAAKTAMQVRCVRGK